MSKSHHEPEIPRTGRRFLLLFLFLLSDLVLYPYVGDKGFGYYAFRLLGSGVVLLSVYAVSFRRSLVLFALLLAIPAMLQRVLLGRIDAGALSIVSTALGFVFDIFVVVIIFRRILAHERPNSETIFGALCIYLLAGFSFANLYRMVAAVQPRAFYFDPLTNLNTIPDRFDFIYYSFATMTALGPAGITPVSRQARSLSVIEAIFGILYLAVLISRLMGAYRRSNEV
jgi:uncharacterized membrane protein